MKEIPQNPYTDQPLSSFPGNISGDVAAFACNDGIDSTEITEPIHTKSDSPIEFPMPQETSEMVQEPTTPEESHEPPYPKYPQFVVRSMDPELTSKEYATKLKDDFARQRAEVSLPHETPVTDAEWAEIQAAHEGLVAVGKELGLDIRDRLPAKSDYHFFDRQTDLDEDAQAQLGRTIPGGCASGQEVGIVIVRGEAGLDRDLYRYTHETSHQVSAISTKVEANVEESAAPESTTARAATAYDDVAGRGLNEVVTDMLTNRALGKMNRMPVVSYYHHAMLYDAAVRETAEALVYMEPREVEGVLIKGLLTGDYEGKGLIERALGEERAARLFEAGEDLDLDTAIALARELDLPRAVESLEGARSGQYAPFFNW
jgi:hypothetical protein